MLEFTSKREHIFSNLNLLSALNFEIISDRRYSLFQHFPLLWCATITAEYWCHRKC